MLLAVTGVAVAQDNRVSLNVEPTLFLPQRASAGVFSLGGGAELGATVDLVLPVYGSGGVGYTFVPTLGPGNLSIITALAGGGLRADLSDTIAYRLGLFAGGYIGVYDDLLAYNPSTELRTSIEVELGGAFRVRAGAGYSYHVGSVGLGPLDENSLAEGLSVRIGASLQPGAAASGPRQPRIEIDEPRFDNVFPVFYQYYNDAPLGTVAITNGERRPIEDVTVSFLVNEYMDAAKRSAIIERMEPGETVEVPILALFRSDVLEITERTSVASQILVEYREGEDVLNAERTETLRILNRNNMTWDDDRKAAAFVSANDPTVLRFARNITAAVRSEGQVAVNERLRTGMAIFQALKLYGMEYVIDPDSSYIELSENSSALDYLQFPQQTLDFRTGDCDDLSILYASLLESVGIRTAFITIPGHIYMAFALDMDEDEARQTFRRPEDLIFRDDEAWLPVEITLVRDDFLAAWDTGAKQWRENDGAGTADFIQVRDAWTTFSPTAFGSEAVAINVPQTPEVIPDYTAILDEFINREIGPQVAELEERIEATNGNPRLINRLGTLYARYGLYEDARVQFDRVLLQDPDYLPALVNMGNIYYLRDDRERALEYFARARNVRADDPEVLISLARVHFDLEQYLPATERYREAELLAPDLAEDFAYIVNENRESGRASAAQDRGRVLWNEE